MADLAPTLADVALIDNTAETEIVQAGEALVQLTPVFLHTDRKWYKCDANDTAAKAACGGITVGKAAADGRVLIVKYGPLNPGCVLTVGDVFVLSDDVGEICPIGDLASTHYVTVLGGAKAAGIFFVDIMALGVQKP